MERPSPARNRTRAPRRKITRFLPFLAFALFGLLILKEQVPAVNRWLQSLFAPKRHAAWEACRRAALDAATHPDYARVRDDGTVHETRNGFYMEGVEIGEMGANGAEMVYRFSCYTNNAGALVDTHKDITQAKKTR